MHSNKPTVRLRYRYVVHTYTRNIYQRFSIERTMKTSRGLLQRCSPQTLSVVTEFWWEKCFHSSQIKCFNVFIVSLDRWYVSIQHIKTRECVVDLESNISVYGSQQRLCWKEERNIRALQTKQAYTCLSRWADALRQEVQRALKYNTKQRQKELFTTVVRHVNKRAWRPNPLYCWRIF